MPRVGESFLSSLIAIDPGKATGIIIGSYSETEPLKIMSNWVTHNGIKEFAQWYWGESLFWSHMAEWIVEDFTLRGSNDFVADLSGVEIIGFLKGIYLQVHWQSRTLKHLVPDSVLKHNGYWTTGKAVGHTDGRDVNDATIHALAWLAKQKHEPTLRMLEKG